ncbi:hypothetical protein [Micromonospora thermarum]|uniref:Uncharacterized protein n=1 Tax=Micromonospora thermarum TaxID=2720024 RepID=A0ABX0Z8X5_9ACTN|nr:hypothetical protein [Micromonospora thermarum]NJP34277.1 hypothetical protein [Micromonospora thermarum]
MGALSKAGEAGGQETGGQGQGQGQPQQGPGQQGQAQPSQAETAAQPAEALRQAGRNLWDVFATVIAHQGQGPQQQKQ